MAARKKHLSFCSNEGAPASSRSLCHSRESPAPVVLCSGSRSGSSGNGCAVRGVEQVAASVPVPSTLHSAEGAFEASELSGSSSPDSPEVGRKSVVSSPPRVESGRGPVARRDSVAVGPGPEALRFLLSDPPPSLMDFQKLVLGREFSEENVPFITGHLRESSKRQFNSVWQSWLLYCRREQPAVIDRDFLLSYLRYLFLRGS